MEFVHEISPPPSLDLRLATRSMQLFVFSPLQRSSDQVPATCFSRREKHNKKQFNQVSLASRKINEVQAKKKPNAGVVPKPTCVNSTKRTGVSVGCALGAGALLRNDKHKSNANSAELVCVCVCVLVCARKGGLTEKGCWLRNSAVSRRRRRRFLRAIS